MLQSVSEPSLGTIGTVKTNATSRSLNVQHDVKFERYRLRGQRFFEGRLLKITNAVILSPWNTWWQIVVQLTIVYQYIIHFLLAYYIETPSVYLDTTVCDLVFFADTFVSILHAFWTLVRLHVRVYRRSLFLILYDVISMFPFVLIFSNYGNLHYLVLTGRLLCIGRIYRLIVFYHYINEFMHKSRRLLLLAEHFSVSMLVLHASTCLWYYIHKDSYDSSKYYNLGYPVHVGSEKIRFDNYLSCWYYCACRLFNVIFGDVFPVYRLEMWLTSLIMIVGYVFLRFQFIGTLTWDLIVENTRRLVFVDEYHHMLNYLKVSGAPAQLAELAQKYKLQLWRMKDGVLTSQHLQKLPLTLQMELIFDINVAHFHNTLLFRDAMETFLRQISLVMRHEIYLAGQHIWSQGVVKNGMICVKRGVIEMLSDEDNESPVIAFKEGTVLGELSVFYSIPAKVTVTAATYVELQVLRRTDFMRAMAEQSSLLHQVREKLENRLRSARKKQKAIAEYDKADSRLIRTRYRPMKVLKNRLAGRKEEDPTFVDDSHLYYKDENNVRQPKFTDDFLELYQMAPKVTTVDAPRICIRSQFPWILEPDTDFTYMFQIAHFFMILYVCIMVPNCTIIRLTQTDFEKVFNIVIVAGLLLNIYLQLTTAIFNKNVVKVTVKEIAEVKMSSFGFYLDILSVFPVYIFTDTLDPYGESAAGQLAALFPILQVWHIWDYIDQWEKNFKSNIKNSWMTQLIYWETKVFLTNNAKHEKPMTTSLLFGTSAFTLAGTSDISPGVTDLLFVVTIFIIGSYLSCFYIAKVCSLFMLATQRRLRFKESMRELFYFLSVNHVSGKIKARVKKFFCVQWYYNNAVSVEELFRDMSTNIRQEVLSIVTVETLLQCPLFQDCSRDFLQTVAVNTRSIVLPDDEVVQHAADIGRDMYIVERGHCNVLDSQGKVVASVGPGSQFGLMEMLFGLPKVYTVLTSTNCILLHVEFSALLQCWSTFPDISHPIMKVLRDSDLERYAAQYETAQPMSGRLDIKTNRIAQEIKESFVVLAGRGVREHYVRAFDKLGVMRFLRYVVIPGVITPHGMFLKFWSTVRCCLAIYYLFAIPYNIAVSHYKFDGRYYTDIVLYFDILIMSYVAYYNEHSLLVTHPLFTIFRYVKHAFLLDFLSTFPFEQVIKIINAQTNLDLFRINKIIQVVRIMGALSYWESDIMRVNQIVILLKFLPLALLVTNFAAAFSFISYCVPFRRPGSLHTMANCTRALVVNGNKFDIKNARMEYISAFIRCFNIFIGSGCTPTQVANETEAWITMFLELSGFLYFAFMCGYIASTRTAAGHALLDHTEKTSDLANFLYQENVDPVLTTKTVKYFEYLWKRTNGSSPQKICRRLNSALMEDTLVFMYERTLREVPLFGKVERSFIRVITQHLTEMYFLKHETVIQYKDVQPYIYIIYRGKVDVMSSYNEMITCMGPGGMFGNFTGQPISCSEVSIYASRSLDLLVISSQTFFNLVKYYPKIQEPLNNAFQVSKDYILPITVNYADDSSSDGSDAEGMSMGSTVDSRSGSSRCELQGLGQISLRSSQSHSNTSQAKSSMSTMTYQSHINLYNLFRPGTWLYQLFGYLTCFMATMNYVLVLYAIITLNDCFFISWTFAVTDCYFYINIFLNIHQGYASKRGELVMDAVKCRRRYFRRKLQFYSDVFVNFPFMLFAFCFPKPKTAMHYLRANKLFRLKYLVEFYRNTAAELTNNITALQAAMTAHAVIFFVHTFTCMWLIVVSALEPISTIRTLKMHNVDDDSPATYWDFSMSFYLIASELTVTGGDEYLIELYFPIAIQNICLLSGKILAAVVVTTAMQVAYASKHALTKYEKATGKLMDVLKNQGLSDYQLKKLWKYIQQLWVTERGRQLPALLAQTPYVRRCDLMSAMFGQHLRNCYIFADTGEPFLRQLTVALDYTVFFPGNYIVVAGDCDARMHWVSSGTVSVVSVRSDLTETTHELLGAGDVFGILQGLHRGVNHCFSYRAETKVSILTLSLDSWIHILPFFPEAQRSISNRSDVLFARI
ncbi:uncharacterized protein isoform X2 [Choristoneura fumiferana]|uniref:uncharacterized protein isoform X2 n=1 Tax=Choristoneura fumiferana TaxID=7141 RepID=UPI003D15A5B1